MELSSSTLMVRERLYEPAAETKGNSSRQEVFNDLLSLVSVFLYHFSSAFPRPLFNVFSFGKECDISMSALKGRRLGHHPPFLLLGTFTTKMSGKAKGLGGIIRRNRKR